MLSVKNDMGFVDYEIVEGKVVFDCYTDPQHRKQGVFKDLLTELMNMYPDKEFCCAVANKKIVAYLLSIGFEGTTQPLPKWGKPNNCVLLIRPVPKLAEEVKPPTKQEELRRQYQLNTNRSFLKPL